MSTIKKKIQSALLLGILGIGLIAIVVTGFGTDGMGGLGGMGGGSQKVETLAEVDGRPVTDVEITARLNLAYQSALQENPNLSREEFYRQAFDPALDELITGRTMAAFAGQLGMVVPQELLDQELSRVFGSEEGFRTYLQQSRRTERDVRAQIEEELLIRMLGRPIAGRGRVPPAVARVYADLLLETRTGEFGAIPTELLALSIRPSDEEVARFYDGNKQLFQQPERRVARYIMIGRDQLGDAVRVSDADIAGYYQRNQARFGPSETRNLQIFTTPDEATARRLADKVRGGTSFVDAARAEGFAPEDVTFAGQRRDQVVQLTSEEVANAVFGSPQGGLVGPIRTSSGFKVVRTDAIVRVEGRSLDAVRGEIVTALEQEKMAEALADRDDQLRERLEAGASLDEIARESNFQIQTTPEITAAGTAPNFQMPADLAAITDAAFQLDANEPDLQEVERDKRIAVVEVTRILPPATPPLDQIRDQVRQRLIQRTAMDRGKVIAEGIVNRINGGMAANQAWAQAGIALPPRQTRTERRSTVEPEGRQVTPPFRVLFAIPEGRARMIAAPDNAGWLIVHHQRRVAGNASTDSEGREALAGAERRLSSSGGPELVTQFARAVAGIVTIERDEDRINAFRERVISGQ